MTETAQLTTAAPAPQAEAPKPSVQDRMKAFLSGSQQQPAAVASSEPAESNQAENADEGQPKEPAKAPKAAQPAADAEVPDGEVEATDSGDADLTSVTELAERTGLTLDRIMDLSIPTKIDGKEGSTTLRQALKNFQLDGHLSNKLKAHADERKAFEAQAQRLQADYQQRLQQVDAGVQVAQRLLAGEFEGINWQELQKSDPATFNQKYVDFQHRQAMLDHIAQQLGTERQQMQQQSAQKHEAFLQEQRELLESKVPEWVDSKARTAEIKEMADVFSEAYGITEQELSALVDHRDFLVARDALRWQKLQKSKPSVVNKVKAAPKLLKPGTAQSQAAQASLATSNARQHLRKTGSLKDAASVFKALGVAKV